MKFPKLKNPLLCSILLYVVVIVGFFIPAIILGIIFKHPLVIIFTILACTIGLIIFIYKNFDNLTLIDITTSLLHCYYSARKSFECKKNGTDPDIIKSKILKRVRFFGLPVEPTDVSPIPEIIRYSIKSSWTIYYKGIDKLFLAYQTEYLDDASLESISRTAKINIKQYAGKGKRILTDPCQKRLKVSVASVVVIFANKIDKKTRTSLYKTLSKKYGDGSLEATLFCVIDLENAIYYFDSVRESVMDYSGYPAKNRAYHMIRKYVFGGKIDTRHNDDYVDIPKGLACYDIDNDTLWSLWRSIKNEDVYRTKKQQKIFKSLQSGEIVFKDDVFYFKLKNRAVDWLVETDDENKKVTITTTETWSYPYSDKLSKKDIQTIKNIAEEYFTSQHYEVTFEK